MAQKQEIDVRIKAILDAGPSIAGLKELKKLQKEVGAGTDNFKLAQQGINDFTDSVKTAKGQSQDWVDSLGSAPGPIGAIARGYDQLTSSTNKWGLAWKATGIGLLVALIGQLVMAFTSNEKAMKKLEPIMIAFEQILGGIFKAVEPVFDIMVDLAIKAMPLVQKAIGGLYAGLAGLASFLKNFFVVQFKNFQAFGKILRGVFTFDYGLIKEGVGDIVDNFKEGFNNVVNTTKETYARFEDGVNDITKTQKKNAKEASDASDKALQKRKENLETEQKLALADLEKKKALDLAAAKSEEERLAIEKKAAEDSYNTKKTTLEKLQALYPKDSKEYKDYTSQLTALDAEYINKKTEFKNKEVDLATKAFQDTVKAKQQENKNIIDDLTSTYNKQKELFGENSAEARKAQDDIFAAQQRAVADELALYEQRKQQVGTFTTDEAARVEELKTQQVGLTNTILIENEKRSKSDLDTALKSAEENKKASDQKFADAFKAAEGDLVLQQKLLDDKKAADEKYAQDQLAREGLTAAQIKAIKDKQLADQKANAEAQVQIEEKKTDAQIKLLNALGAAANALADLVGKNTFAGKALAVAASLINTYAAIAGSLAQYSKPGAPPIPGYAIAQAVATGLVGFKAVADIIKTPVPNASGGGGTPEQPRKLALGGIVRGAGSGRSDLVPAMLSNGESVINAQSTALFKPLLSSINAVGGGKRFADGGLAVGSFSQDQALSQLQSSLAFQSAPIKTYVVASDMTSQQMMDRNIKERSTL